VDSSQRRKHDPGRRHDQAGPGVAHAAVQRAGRRRRRLLQLPESWREGGGVAGQQDVQQRRAGPRKTDDNERTRQGEVVEVGPSFPRVDECLGGHDPPQQLGADREPAEVREVGGRGIGEEDVQTWVVRLDRPAEPSRRPATQVLGVEADRRATGHLLPRPRDSVHPPGGTERVRRHPLVVALARGTPRAAWCRSRPTASSGRESSQQSRRFPPRSTNATIPAQFAPRTPIASSAAHAVP
jgi:hypothetical protein